MNDTISRNDVCNLFDRDSAGKYWGKINNDLLHEIWCDIKNLPSAEPEIIRCGECAHKDKKIDYCHRLGITICECDYCSFAERRTDETD